MIKTIDKVQACASFVDNEAPTTAPINITDLASLMAECLSTPHNLIGLFFSARALERQMVSELD
jgi:hypothetical protein